ncbi:MAG: pantoate--beta-alanine ligase [Saprospirales bacterium]|nr:MAG: pantoate--beta-alanine ligase [Saprospirales bacterium]
MNVFTKAAELLAFTGELRNKGMCIGFVPTMGALHKGHLSLVRESVLQSDFTICSIFVNPTQFNDPKDLKEYPRTLETDIVLLENEGCDMLFLPEVEEIYPRGMGYHLNFDAGYLENILEGEFRPGHFKGVAQVVYRLLELVQADRVFMGEKDFQQLAVVEKLIRDTGLEVVLVRCETVREPDGLAMSSRNLRLDTKARKEAGAIYDTLIKCREWVNEYTVEEIRDLALKKLSQGGLKPEYFELVDPVTLSILTPGRVEGPVVACVAAYAGSVRLIDNMRIG